MPKMVGSDFRVLIPSICSFFFRGRSFFRFCKNMVARCTGENTHALGINTLLRGISTSFLRQLYQLSLVLYPGFGTQINECAKNWAPSL